MYNFLYDGTSPTFTYTYKSLARDSCREEAENYKISPPSYKSEADVVRWYDVEGSAKSRLRVPKSLLNSCGNVIYKDIVPEVRSLAEPRWEP